VTVANETTVGRSAGARAGLAIVISVVAVVVVMVGMGSAAYLWVKAAHVVAIIAWMAGLLYLPRLFVYHADSPMGSEQSETFKVMERRLLNVIMRPAMVIAWVLGLWLAWQGHHWSEHWFQAKVALVVVLSGFHDYLSAAARAFADNRNTRTARHWRIMNEVPTLLMIAIVILVIVKPF